MHGRIEGAAAYPPSGGKGCHHSIHISAGIEVSPFPFCHKYKTGAPQSDLRRKNGLFFSVCPLKFRGRLYFPNHYMVQNPRSI
jgi:hypothetical protein